MSDNIASLIQNSIDWAKSQHPNSTPNQQTAFARSVAYLVSGERLTGRSIREHSLHAIVRDPAYQDFKIEDPINPDREMPPAGNWNLHSAYALAEVVCFGELLPGAWRLYEGFPCYGDDQADRNTCRLQCLQS